MKELMIHVERAVRPVQAKAERKLKMRQELLAHLTAIFEEERARLSDERAALDAALQRFGDPSTLTHELQAHVPFLERMTAVPAGWVFTTLLMQRPEEPARRHAFRLALLFAVFAFCCFLPVLFMRIAVQDSWHQVRGGLFGGLVVTGYGFLSVLVGYGFYQALAAGWSVTGLLRALAWSAAAILVAALLVVSGNYLQPSNSMWWLILHMPDTPFAWIAFACFAALPLLVTLLFVVVVRIEKSKLRGLEEWTTLEIAE